ncbi:MAG TPA: AraC family transcriptional regulator [Anaerolineae bacterium]|jgi:AraC-like DNA-binding protein
MTGYYNVETSKFWHAQDIGNLELLRATYITHTFSRHVHEGFAIGVIERGAEMFYYRGETHVASAGTIVVINPGEVHTGQAVDETGWTYRMLYPEVALLRQAASEASGRPHGIPFFPSPVFRDDYLAGLIRKLHFTLEKSVSALERQSHFLETLVQLILRHADNRPVLPAMFDLHPGIGQVRAFLEAHYAQNVSLEQLSGIAGVSSFHLTRLFRESVGLPPHAYLNQVRIFHAKKLLTLGQSIAEVAFETGFADQSHLNRHFKRIVGVTPGQYSKNIQDR